MKVSKMAPELIIKIEKYLATQVLLPDPVRLIIAAWILGTYVYDRFDRFPQLVIEGGPGVGKTVIGKTVADVSYRTLQGAYTVMTLLRHVGTVLVDLEDEPAEIKDSPGALQKALELGGMKGRPLMRGIDEVYETFRPYIIIDSQREMQEHIGFHFQMVPCDMQDYIDHGLPLTIPDETPTAALELIEELTKFQQDFREVSDSELSTYKLIEDHPIAQFRTLRMTSLMCPLLILASPDKVLLTLLCDAYDEVIQSRKVENAACND